MSIPRSSPTIWVADYQFRNYGVKKRKVLDETRFCKAFYYNRPVIVPVETRTEWDDADSIAITKSYVHCPASDSLFESSLVKTPLATMTDLSAEFCWNSSHRPTSGLGLWFSVGNRRL